MAPSALDRGFFSKHAANFSFIPAQLKLDYSLILVWKLRLLA
jgi:hypothetical protein